MTISSINWFSFENPYTSATQAKNLSDGYSLFAGEEEKKKQGSSANSAQSGAVTGTGVTNYTTANTLWETQSYAQSEESKAVDAEELGVKDGRTAEEKFLEFMNKTPEELMREAILKELGYTEEELAAMKPKERAAAEEKIRQRVEQKVKEALREEGTDIDTSKYAAELRAVYMGPSGIYSLSPTA